MPQGKRTSPRQRRLRRWFSLLLALVAAGIVASALTPQRQTAAAQDAGLARQGQQLYLNSCVDCHGPQLQGVEGRGPSLIGAGEAKVYFQVSTGRMPLPRQQAQGQRKPAEFSEDQIRALMAYVHSFGGGAEMPDERGTALRGNVARGGELFRLNCAACHNFTGRGGALTSGKFAPSLDPANEEQIYTAMLTGPSNMPVFGDRQLSPEEKRDIIAYVDSVQHERNNYGGHPLGTLGPVSEGAVAWVVGIAILVLLALWIGARA
ncbi:menaquinol-cytochrome c reductase cytochrome c1 subunit precursor [Lentzea atacamensis]|uniref:Cytochrome bc1 complex cytochrome c subunit n=1 Tax=Lentzea atacamensis TaxID=531938 RepID=A0A316HSJ1_9PSEU|nr:c-type cytochrome [Lentzea atacamensis]PWK83563.1 menaquinol-cytochrome c reductase cytochrome c1 subunit precursor [Lentzea atacamensis]